MAARYLRPPPPPYLKVMAHGACWFAVTVMTGYGGYGGYGGLALNVVITAGGAADFPAAHGFS